MDVRVRTFAGEARRCFGFLVDDLGFDEPVVTTRAGTTPVSLTWAGVSTVVECSLELAPMGADQVVTQIVTLGPDAAPDRETVGESTAHTGYQMRRALERQSVSLRITLTGRPRVEVHDLGVRRALADGRVEDVRWDELGEVRVVTTSAGPYLDDVFFCLLARDGVRGAVVAQSAAPDHLVARLQALPGFDNAALITALTSTGDRQHRLWTDDRTST